MFGLKMPIHTLEVFGAFEMGSDINKKTQKAHLYMERRRMTYR